MTSEPEVAPGVWELVEWVPEFWKNKAPEKPTPEAELTGNGAWCAHFVDNRPVATWFRRPT